VNTVEDLRDAAAAGAVLGVDVPAKHSRALPVEYWDEEGPRKPTPFGLEKVNRRLARLAGRWRERTSR
jgi:hypothetical protein